MIRALMLTTDLQRGGLPLRLVRLASALRAFDIRPTVGCLAGRGPLSEWLESAGIETFACDARGSYDAGCLARLARQIRRAAPDLIHASLFHANLAARLVGRLDRARPIITSTVTIEIERGWHRWLEALTADRSDRHVANSAAVARHLREDLGFSPDRVVVIPNGLDIEEINRAPRIAREKWGLDGDVPLVAWAGRMDPVKDLETFVETIAAVGRRRRVRAVLIGDGPERSRVEDLIAQHGLSSVIAMALWSDNVAGWMKTADLMLFPSRTEGSPNAVIEAMVCGCPVVASDLPATRELLAGGAGWLCRTGDVEGFRAAVEEVLDGAALRRSTVASAMARAAERHGLQGVVEQWAKLYLEVISRLKQDR
jgi:glycosyltransferase involved in cell wall biosynthesis